jgi:hypothetical protein
VARLPAAKVVQFLTKVIAKLEAKPSRGQNLAKWIRAVLVQHTAHLMSVPALVSKLSGLYQVRPPLETHRALCIRGGGLWVCAPPHLGLSGCCVFTCAAVSVGMACFVSGMRSYCAFPLAWACVHSC